MKNFFWYSVTNFFIIAGISVLGYFLYGDILLTKLGINYKYLLLFALFWGFTISIASLLLSKYIAKYYLGILILNPKNKLPYRERELLDRIKKISQKAGVPMPQVGFYESDELNAFVTGFNEKNTLMAFTTNLFDVMDWDEIEGVIAHELAHVKNGDMITMTIIQGLINAFTIFMAKLVSFSIIEAIFGEKFKYMAIIHIINTWVTTIIQIIFSFFGLIVSSFFSRHREYSADLMATQFVEPKKVIKALYCLLKHENFAQYNKIKYDENFKTMKAHSYNYTSFFGLYDTHPSLIKRIDYIKKNCNLKHE